MSGDVEDVTWARQYHHILQQCLLAPAVQGPGPLQTTWIQVCWTWERWWQRIAGGTSVEMCYTTVSTRRCSHAGDLRGVGDGVRGRSLSGVSSKTQQVQGNIHTHSAARKSPRWAWLPTHAYLLYRWRRHGHRCSSGITRF